MQKQLMRARSTNYSNGDLHRQHVGEVAQSQGTYISPGENFSDFGAISHEAQSM